MKKKEGWIRKEAGVLTMTVLDAGVYSFVALF